LRNSVNLIEEVGRIAGYETLPPNMLPKAHGEANINKAIYYAQAIREVLKAEGYSEVFTYAFTNTGDIRVAKAIAEDKGALRPNLSMGLAKSLELNARSADLLGVDAVKIFEIGTVFPQAGEHVSLGIGVWQPKGFKGLKADAEIARVTDILAKKYNCKFPGKPTSAKEGTLYEAALSDIIATATEPQRYDDIFKTEAERVTYKKISLYPSITRDIALWADIGTTQEEVSSTLEAHAGTLLVRKPRLFDVFEKKDTGKVSYAFRLVFQSMEKTLTDEEVNGYMQSVNNAVAEKGWAVR
jgi:phenylalanyl-tRNA synthetase beta subunit